MTLRELGQASDYELAYLEEDLLLRVTEQVCELLVESGARQVDLAQALGRTESHVSQLLSGNRNMTLKTLARLAFVLGTQLDLSFRREPRSGRYRLVHGAGSQLWHDESDPQMSLAA